MNHYFKTLIALLFCSNSLLFAQFHESGNVAKVSAKEGITLYAQPSIKSNKITTIPYEASLYYYIVSKLAISGDNTLPDPYKNIASDNLISTIPYDVYYYINPKANKEENKVLTIPYFIHKYQNLKHIAQVDKSDKIGNVLDYWRHVYYNGEFGYVFGADLAYTPEKEAIESHIFVSNGSIVSAIPNIDGLVLCLLGKGAEVYVFEPQNISTQDWVKVRYKDLIGFMQSKFLVAKKDFENVLEIESRN